MDDLYTLDKKLGELYDKIPLADRGTDVDSPQKDAYNSALSEFLKCGQKVFDDESLGVDQLLTKMKQYSVSSVKEILTHEPQEILVSIQGMDKVAEDSLIRLEYFLSCKREDPRAFNEDDMFASDREYLAAFSDEEIASFENFQNYIRRSSDLSLIQVSEP
ncbi:MAG: hypothetical protein K2L98_00065, partial [Bacilli bacterium]|nr:hypothetical protein [Bacilli bacterium]